MADNTGVLVEQRLMGAGSSASGPARSVRQAPARRPGANYTAGITEIPTAASPTRHNANTSALRIQRRHPRRNRHPDRRHRPVRLDGGDFSGPGTTTWSSGSQTTITGLVELASGPTVRLNGATTWSAGDVYITNAGSSRTRARSPSPATSTSSSRHERCARVPQSRRPDDGRRGPTLALTFPCNSTEACSAAAGRSAAPCTTAADGRGRRPAHHRRLHAGPGAAPACGDRHAGPTG